MTAEASSWPPVVLQIDRHQTWCYKVRIQVQQPRLHFFLFLTMLRCALSSVAGLYNTNIYNSLNSTCGYWSFNSGASIMGWLDITAFYSTGFSPLPASLMQFYFPNLPDLLRTAAHWLSKGSHMPPRPWAQLTVYIHTSLKIRIKICDSSGTDANYPTGLPLLSRAARLCHPRRHHYMEAYVSAYV